MQPLHYAYLDGVMENPFKSNHKRRVWQKGPPLGSQELKTYVRSSRVKDPVWFPRVPEDSPQFLKVL